MMDLQTLEYIVNNGVATIRMNRPESLNALNVAMVREFEQVIAALEEDNQVRAVILTGTGRAFNAGGDVKESIQMVANQDVADRRAVMVRLHRWVTKLINLEKPVIAAVNGLAVGAGLSLAIMADFIIAAENAQFAMAFQGIGLAPDFAAMYLLPRMVGLPLAKQLTFTGETVDANRALQIGLVSQVVPADQLESVARQLAEGLAQGPTRAYGIAKGIMNRSFESSLAEQLDLEIYAQALSMGTEDFREGINAFIGKRTPIFQGR